MRTEMQPVFLAFDGTPFLTEKDCVAYEDGHWHKQLVGMTLEQVIAALERNDIDRANAFERAARKIAKLRVEAGDRLRAPKKADEPAPQIDERGADVVVYAEEEAA